MDPHRLAEERSLAYHAMVGERLLATLPAGWKERLVPVRNDNTRGATGWCLEAHDLVLSKLVADREKDLVIAEEAVRHRLVVVDTLAERLRITPVSEELRPLIEQRVQSLAALR